MAIVRAASIRRLQRKLRPTADEGQVFIRTVAHVRDGAGPREAELLRGPIPARISFDPQNRVEEKPMAGQVSALHRHLIELPAYEPIDEKATILIAAPPRRSSERISAGERRIPAVPNGAVYVAETEGATGSTEPS